VQPQIPPDVSRLIDDLLGGTLSALGDNLVGFYLSGSLALGGFDSKTSDVDVVVVTARPLSTAEMEALTRLHERLPPNDNAYSQQYEVYYLDRATVRKFAHGQQHVKVGPDEPLHQTEHRPNWVIERWTVRERGITLAGPDPTTLIDLVSPDDLRNAAIDEMRKRLERWSEGTWPVDELSRRGAQAFEIHTTCRALYTAESGELATKAQAVTWALKTLPRRWHPLVEWSQHHRGELAHDTDKIPEIMTFLRWAAAYAGAA
jgi:hypothetical protein